jgi:hypothetical protein
MLTIWLVLGVHLRGKIIEIIKRRQNSEQNYDSNYCDSCAAEVTSCVLHPGYNTFFTNRQSLIKVNIFCHLYIFKKKFRLCFNEYDIKIFYKYSYMLFRTNKGELVEIKKYDFPNDKLYYQKLMEIKKSIKPAPFAKL